MNKKNKNIIFISMIPIFIIIVMVHNYFYDLNNIFAKKRGLNIYFCSKEYANLCLEEDKVNKHEILFVGSSEIFIFLNSKELFKNLAIHKYSIKELYEMLDYYLNLHPETKKVYIFLGINILFFHYPEEPFSTQKIENKFLLKLKLLLDFTPITTHIVNKIYKPKNFQRVDKKAQGKAYFPFDMKNYAKEHSIINNYDEENKLYIRKMVELFNSKDVQFTFIIPPVNMIASSTLYLSPDFYNQEENFKRYIVNNFGPIYDFSRSNRFTRRNLLDGTNDLYKDPVHFNKRYGIKLLNFLLFDYNPYNDLFYLLTKDNIEENLQKEREEIVKFIQENKSYVEYYIEHGGVDRLYYKVIDDNSISKEHEKDLEFFEQKMSELKINPSLFTVQKQ